MELTQLIKTDNINNKIDNSITQFRKLIDILNTKNIPENIIEKINSEITILNTTDVTDKTFLQLVKKKQSSIIRLIEKELKLVPKNYYRKLWLILGMTAFGLPLGVAFGLSIGNMGLIGIGLPIGMAIGALAGSFMDKKAFENGKQLDIELN